jgi:hypothetical protein
MIPVSLGYSKEKPNMARLGWSQNNPDKKRMPDPGIGNGHQEPNSKNKQ